MTRVVVLLILIQLLSVVVNAWLPSYTPEYCNSQPEERVLTPLTPAERAQVGSLIQVQALIRHGSRTPYSSSEVCWANYDIKWRECNVTWVIAPNDVADVKFAPPALLFRLRYDAFVDELGGDCMTGQLLKKGYEQSFINGILFADAYVRNAFDSKLNLFPSNTSWESFDQQTVYLRSDDEERTMASGQAFSSSFFNFSLSKTFTQTQTLTWHTGDDSIDDISDNSRACPALKRLASAAYASPAFVAQNTSDEIVAITQQDTKVLGLSTFWPNALDCFMTTVCSYNQLPSGMTEELFNSTLAQAQYVEAYKLLYNNSAYAKAGIGSLARTILNNLDSTSTLKFALFSGHDTTLMPLLAAIFGKGWDGTWVSYASSMSIEQYANAVSGEKNLFRLLYNGKPMLVPGCSTYLCSVVELKNALAFGLVADQACLDASSPTSPTSSSPSSPSSSSYASLATEDWVGLIFLSFFLGLLIGAAAIVFMNRRKRRNEQMRTNKLLFGNSTPSPLSLTSGN